MKTAPTTSRSLIKGKRSTASRGPRTSTGRPKVLAMAAWRRFSSIRRGEEARRRLPTGRQSGSWPVSSPSRAYRSALNIMIRVRLSEPRSCPTSPAACHVEPLVRSALSRRTTSRQPSSPPPMITACASDFIPVPPEGVPRAAPCTAGEHRGYQGTGGPATDGEYAYAVREPSIPQADIIQEAERLTAAVQRTGTVLKLTGGLGVYFHSPSTRREPLRREYRDLDFVSLSGQRAAVQRLLEDLGYAPDIPFNTLQGQRRLRFWDGRHRRQVDGFLDQL